MTKEELEKKRDEMAELFASYNIEAICALNIDPGEINLKDNTCSSFSSGFNAAVELLWPEIEKVEK